MVLQQPFSEGGRDATKYLFRRTQLQSAINCLVQKYRAGHIDKSTPGCFVASIILYCSLGVVLSIVLARFFMALIFSWFISRKLSRAPPAATRSAPMINNNDDENNTATAQKVNVVMEMDNITRSTTPNGTVQVGNDLYTVMLITCYSENMEGIRATVESLSQTSYPDDRKLLFLIADGIITGSGETLSTPDQCLSLISFNPNRPDLQHPEAQSYIAVANGTKMHNCAKVYAGHYSKCGTFLRV
jgi:chitin synthase